MPIAGVFWRKWSDATAIAFYWCETLLLVLFASLRVIVHQRITNTRRAYLGGFLTLAGAFGTANLI
jgi:hypothetical protein